MHMFRSAFVWIRKMVDYLQHPFNSKTNEPPTRTLAVVPLEGNWEDVADKGIWLQLICLAAPASIELVDKPWASIGPPFVLSRCCHIEQKHGGHSQKVNHLSVVQRSSHEAKTVAGQPPKTQGTLLQSKDLPDGIHEADVTKKIMAAAIGQVIDSLP